MVDSWIAELRSELGGRLPQFLKDEVARTRRSYREKSANVEFLRRDLPEVSASADAPQHIVCVVVDALRADAVSADSAPFLDSLEGTTAIAAAPWTFPSVTSILTGQYPHNHGAMRQSDSVEETDEVTVPPKLPESTVTLPEYLGGAGYDTFGAFGFPVPFLAANGTFRHHSLFPWDENAAASKVLQTYLSWLEGREQRCTFAYLHLADLHAPVNPPEPYWSDHQVDKQISNIRDWDFRDGTETGIDANRYRKHRKRLYKAALAYVDDELRTFDQKLSQRLSDLITIITSDHGEAFWEEAAFDAEHFRDPRSVHGVGHGDTPYESVARVPLLSQHLTFADRPTSLVDIAPTLLNEANINLHGSVDGRIHSPEWTDDRILLIEATRHGYERKAAYQGRWKLLVSQGDSEKVGFEVPEERVVELPPDVESDLNEALPAWPTEGEERRVTGEVRQQLENLGYT